MTTVLGNGNCCIGVSPKPAICAGQLGPCRSGTATNSAPAAGACDFAAQCAIVRQARLCATSTTCGPARSTAASTAAPHSAQTGLSQSRCCIREKFGCAFSQRVCQCCGPELPKPGKMSTGEDKLETCALRLVIVHPCQTGNCRPQERTGVQAMKTEHGMEGKSETRPAGFCVPFGNDG